RFLMYKQDALPPAHLLRHVFETAKTYEEAKKLLAETPVSIPVIYILSGIKENEGCVIERTESSAHIRELADNDNIAAANHFSPQLASNAIDWRSRGLGRFRGVDSYARANMMCGLDKNNITADEFDWFQYPVANYLTRLVVITNATTTSLKVMGTNAEKPVTEVFKL
ncbi:MAG: carcinine hydrolase/isopenicillin-N N-acyltransferase family protein, partial [Rickettsiales bacterium]